MNAILVASDGSLAQSSPWFEDPTDADREVLALAVPPVLDIGCGPGRHVLALAADGIPALGIDISPNAIDLARSKGAPVIERSLFERLPGQGRWASCLLLDGNIGIGGDPDALLARVRELLRPGGRLLVETGPPDVPLERLVVRVESGSQVSDWIPWARVGASELPALATPGFRVERSWMTRNRWFSCLAAC